MKIANNISWKSLQDKVVAVNVTTGAYYTMNTTASDIFQAIGRGLQQEELLEMLKKDYPDVEPATLEADLKEQLDDWAREQLIR